MGDQWRAVEGFENDACLWTQARLNEAASAADAAACSK
jgi:hypothetical protein